MDGSSDVGAGDSAEASSDATVAEAGDDTSDATFVEAGDAADATDDATDDATAADAFDGNVDAGPDTGPLDGSSDAGPSNPADRCGGPLPGAPPSGQVLDLGHGASIVFVRQLGNRILSEDQQSHWVLWDVATRSRVAIGDTLPQANDPDTDKVIWGFVDMQGSTMVAERRDASIEIRRVSDGGVSVTVPTDATHFGIAADGSYVWGASTTKLTFWSPTGAVIGTRAGNYLAATIYSAPSELRVALGPVGRNVIELINPSTGASVVTPSFQGTFSSWFVDGARFISAIGSDIWVYPKSSGTFDGIFAVGADVSNYSFGGEGNYFWSYSDIGSTPHTLNIFAATGGAPVKSYAYGSTADAFVREAANLLLVIGGGPQLQLIDLEPGSITDSLLSVTAIQTFAASSPTAWSIGDPNGVVWDSVNVAAAGGPYTLGCGKPLAIAGASDGTSVVATYDSVFVLQTTSSGTTTVKARAALVMAGPRLFMDPHIELSGAGDLMAVTTGTGLSLYSMPSVSLVRTLPYGTRPGTTPPILTDFTLSNAGTRIGVVTSAGNIMAGPFDRRTTDLTGTLTEFHDSGKAGARLVLSPNGSGVAASDADSFGPTTSIYESGVLTGAIPGAPIGWLDETHLVVQVSTVTGYKGETDICDQKGTILSSPKGLPAMGPFQVLGPNLVYDEARGAVYNLATGATVWTSAFKAQPGALAGPMAVGIDRYRIVAEVP